jgi:hypothetical protein
MNRKILFVRVISAFFFVSALITFGSLFWIKTSSVFFTVYIVLYASAIVIIAIGLLKLVPWARPASIIILLITLVRSLIHIFQDIRTMANHSVDLYTIILSAITIIIPVSLQIIIIWWLWKDSTKLLFERRDAH